MDLLMSLAGLVGSIPTGVFLADPAGRIIFANDLALEVTGSSLVGASAFDWSRPAPGPPLEGGVPLAGVPADEPTLAGGAVRWRSLGLGRREAWVDTEVRSWCSPAGELLGLVGVVSDVTEEVRREGDRRETHAILEAVLATQRDAVIVVDGASKVVSFNRAAEAMFGVRHGDVVDAPLERFISGGDGAIPAPDLPARTPPGGPARRTRTPDRAPTRALRHDGSSFPAEIDAARVPGAEGLFTLIVRDVSDRQRVEHQSRQADRRFRAAFGQSAVGMAVVTTSGRFIEVNDALCRFLGYEAAELRGADVSLVSDEETLAHEQEMLREIESGVRAGFRVRERSYRCRDGGTALGDLVASVVRDDDGTAKYLVCQVVDVGGRVRSDQAPPAVEQAEDAGRAAKGLAHDLANLLTIVRGNVEGVQDALDGDDRAHRALASALLAVGRSDALVAELAKLGEPRPASRSPVDANWLVIEMARMLEAVLGSDVGLEVRCDASQATVQADPSALGRVLLNLVLNARDAITGPGSITIRTSDEPAAATGRVVAGEASTAPHGWLVLTVADTGRGVSPELRDRIFDPGTSTTGRPRSGLGLPTSRLIVEADGGTVSLRSTSPAGSTFEVRLPVAAGRPVVPGDRTGSTTPDPGGRGRGVHAPAPDRPGHRTSSAMPRVP